ncbi:phosphatidylethanolamine N-methyltransferase isoform X1 [Arapaima gigas]
MGLTLASCVGEGFFSLLYIFLQFLFLWINNNFFLLSPFLHLSSQCSNASPTGIVLTAVVALTYQAAILFEGPFTEEIYRQRMRGSKQQ